MNEKQRYLNNPERRRKLKPSLYEAAINGLSFSINNPRGLVLRNRKQRVTSEQLSGDDIYRRQANELVERVGEDE